MGCDLISLLIKAASKVNAHRERLVGQKYVLDDQELSRLGGKRNGSNSPKPEMNKGLWLLKVMNQCHNTF